MDYILRMCLEHVPYLNFAPLHRVPCSRSMGVQIDYLINLFVIPEFSILQSVGQQVARASVAFVNINSGQVYASRCHYHNHFY